jgi:hypothetical protein
LVCQQHRRFRFDLRYQALLGCSRRQLEDPLAQGFPLLPPGCRLVLDRVCSERVLANLRQCLPSRRPQLLQELRALAAEGVIGPSSGTDLLFITLRKSEALFSTSPRYRDLALGPSLFHWESQSTTTAASPMGQRYIHHASRGSRVLLFVREQRKQDGRPGAPTEPFVCLGFATYESHEGERPMA